MPLFAAASRAALVELVCPRCGERQVRAREKPDHAYTCKRCHHVFVRNAEAGEATEATGATSPPSSKPPPR